VEKAVEERLPKTFTVISPRHKTKHFYFFGKIIKHLTFKPTADGDPCADLKHGNAYVCGAGSDFSSYGKYVVGDDEPIATITEEQLAAAVNEFISIKKPKKNKSSKEIISKHPELNFPIDKIVELKDFSKSGDERAGPHPTHGSTTGSNFKVDTAKNVWYCWRHEVGGGPLELLAVLNHIIDCENVGKGLRGTQFVQTVKKAIELGLIQDFNFDSLKGIENNDIGSLLDKLNTIFIFKTPTDLEEIHCYDNGVYVLAEHKVKSTLENWLGSRCSTGLVNEVLNHIRRQSFIDRTEFNKFRGYLPVQNGLLNLDTEELKDFTDGEIFTFKLNVAYDKDKKCPKFLAWLNQVQTPENILTLQEYAGYCLLPSFPFHRSMWFIGNGRNGKGTFIITLEYILGLVNCAHINIQSFNGERNFSEAQLYGKLINVSSEPTTNRELETPLFKKITGDDYIEAEVKCKQRRLGFRNMAKFFILGNKYPKVNDNTTAFWERIIILPWDNTFLEGNGQIQHIENQWLKNPDEVSGILNWMLSGLRRLLDNQHFTLSKTQKQNMIEFKRASDPTDAWIEEKVIFDSKKFVVREDAHYHYKTYCDDFGLIADDEKKFYARLRNTPRVKDCQLRVKGKPKRGFKGIELKSNSEFEEENPNNSIADYGSVTDVTAVTAKAKSKNPENNENKESKIGVTAASPVTPASRCCGDCGRFHLASCYFPHGNFETIPADWYAGECRGFIPKQPEMPRFEEKGEPPDKES
jgi:P4 family phage/plasmid primase-like protien